MKWTFAPEPRKSPKPNWFLPVNGAVVWELPYKVENTCAACPLDTRVLASNWPSPTMGNYSPFTQNTPRW